MMKKKEYILKMKYKQRTKNRLNFRYILFSSYDVSKSVLGHFVCKFTLYFRI